MIFGGPELDRRFLDHEVRAARFASQLGERERSRNEFEESEFPLKNRGRTGQPFGGQEGGEDAVPRRVGERAALPFREFARPRLTQRDVGRARQVERLRDFVGIEAQQLGRRRGRRERTVRDVIPSVLADRGGVAHPALDFVSKDRGRDQIAALGPGDLAHCEHGGEIVARMGRLERQIGVVVIEVAEEDAVGEGRQVGARLAASAEEARARFGRDPRRDTPRDEGAAAS